MTVKIKALQFSMKVHRKMDYMAVKHYYERLGWKIVLFTENTDAIIKLDLLKKARTKKGFIYNEDNFKFIFIRKDLSELEKRDVIFHEAGHIELEHKYIEMDSDFAEMQADEFSTYLIEQCRKNRTLSLIKASALSVFIISLCLIVHHITIADASLHSNIKYDIETTENIRSIDSNIFDDNIKSVFVTPFGSKYHLPDCRYVRYNTRAYEIDFDTAIEVYLPCSYCIK